MNPAGVEEDPLGERGLARVYVSGDSDVPDAFHGFLPSRILVLFFGTGGAG